MNLAIRGIDSNFGTHVADTFHANLHRDLHADLIIIIANPPFNMSDWGGALLAKDQRWRGRHLPAMPIMPGCSISSRI